MDGSRDAVNPEKQGTKVAAHYRLMVEPGQSTSVRLRLTNQAAVRERGKPKTAATVFGGPFDKIFDARQQEADDFYQAVIPPSVSPDEAGVMRQALAGMLWSKQYFFFDGDNWLDEHNTVSYTHLDVYKRQVSVKTSNAICVKFKLSTAGFVLDKT